MSPTSLYSVIFMAIAHLCSSCGRDLARVRSRREPHYGLRLVSCPDCQSPCVRDEHPVWRGWSRGRRAGTALSVIAARLFITLILTALNVLATIGSLALWSEVRSGKAPLGAVSFVVLMFALLALLTGVWLTAGFEHIARWKVWMGWLAWLALILVIVSLHGPLGLDIDPRGLDDDPASRWRWAVDGVIGVALPATMCATLLLLAALPGIAIGQGLLWLTGLVRRARWRAFYRRAHVAGNLSWE
jgi:hypothetical protein